MDIFLSPTKYESYGYTLIEAQSHKIPVVVTDTPVTRDLLQNKVQFYRTVLLANSPKR